MTRVGTRGAGTGTFDTVSQSSIAEAQRTWSHAKKKLRRQFRKNARQVNS